MRDMLIILLTLSLSFVFGVKDVYASCSDIPLGCFAFCNSGPKAKQTSIGRCQNYATCDVEACSDYVGRARNNCDAVFYNDPDSPCVVTTGNYYD